MISKHRPHGVRVDVNESHSARRLVVLPMFSSLTPSESIRWLVDSKTALRDSSPPILIKIVKGLWRLRVSLSLQPASSWKDPATTFVSGLRRRSRALQFNVRFRKLSSAGPRDDHDTSRFCSQTIFDKRTVALSFQLRDEPLDAELLVLLRAIQHPRDTAGPESLSS